MKQKNEEKFCGECCWFYGEDTDGWGFCACQKGGLDSTNCSDVCQDDFVSRQDMRHHMAVLLQWERYNKSPRHQLICRVPSNSDRDAAMKFAYKYMRTFSNI